MPNAYVNALTFKGSSLHVANRRWWQLGIGRAEEACSSTNETPLRHIADTITLIDIALQGRLPHIFSMRLREPKNRDLTCNRCTDSAFYLPLLLILLWPFYLCCCYMLTCWNSARLRLRAEDTVLHQECKIGRACLHPPSFLHSARYIDSIQQAYSQSELPFHHDYNAKSGNRPLYLLSWSRRRLAVELRTVIQLAHLP